MSDNIIVITGAAGNIAYSFIFMALERGLFGNNVILHLFDLQNRLETLSALKMELEDSAYSDLRSVLITSDPYEAFLGASWCIMLGSYPRKAGMERIDLISSNANIFYQQGIIIGKVAKPDVQVVVVGNPCNTNAMIAHSASGLDESSFSALAMLDQNRASSAFAKHLNIDIKDLDHVNVLGNHSTTVVSDVFNAKYKGENVNLDHSWVYDYLIPFVQKRGCEIINARKMSSAASAAKAIIDHIECLQLKCDRIFSMSKFLHKPYLNAPAGSWPSLPYKVVDGKIVQVEDLFYSEKMIDLIKISFDELVSERDFCLDFLD